MRMGFGESEFLACCALGFAVVTAAHAAPLSDGKFVLVQLIGVIAIGVAGVLMHKRRLPSHVLTAMGLAGGVALLSWSVLGREAGLGTVALSLIGCGCACAAMCFRGRALVWLWEAFEGPGRPTDYGESHIDMWMRWQREDEARLRSQQRPD